MGCAQTGTGKTCCLRRCPCCSGSAPTAPRKPGAIRALILTPTRELALQIGESFEAYGKYLTLRATVIFGGVGQSSAGGGPAKRAWTSSSPRPGRLNDLHRAGALSTLDQLEIFVLDEADRMLDMGFVHDVKKVIAKAAQADARTCMFSATMPPEIEQLAAGILHDPRLGGGGPGLLHRWTRIEQSLYFVDKGNKKLLLPWLIKNLEPPVVNALVFTRTKHGADKVAKDLDKAGHPRRRHPRQQEPDRPRSRRWRTSRPARPRCWWPPTSPPGAWTSSELSHVFNYDLPEVPETYVHRIGRTARAGADGTAVSFCAPEEQEYLAGIEKLNRRQIPVDLRPPLGRRACPGESSAPGAGQKTQDGGRSRGPG